MRLIDADAIPYFGEVYGHDRVTFKARIDTLPTIDAEPVRHGHWIEEGQAYNGDFLIRCSACRRVLSEAKQIGYVRKYCPNCGAKMDEEVNT